MGAVFGLLGSDPAAADTLVGKMHSAAGFRGTVLSKRIGEGFALGASCHPHEVGPFLVANQARTVFAACESELYNAHDLAKTLGFSEASRGFGIVPALFERGGRTSRAS